VSQQEEEEEWRIFPSSDLDRNTLEHEQISVSVCVCVCVCVSLSTASVTQQSFVSVAVNPCRGLICRPAKCLRNTAGHKELKDLH